MNTEKIREKVLTALKIREEIQNIFKRYNVSTSYSEDRVNPLYNQMDEETEGFICEYYYGHPSKIYTPLGYLTITTSYFSADQNVANAIKEIEETFGLVLKKEELKTCIGVFGAWYSITKLPWSAAELARDCNERNRSEYIAYAKVNELYSEIVAG